MSGLFLAAKGADYGKIKIVAVNPQTPAANAGLRVGDEIVSIDAQRTPRLTLDRARSELRVPGSRKLEIRRDGGVLRVTLETRRLI